MGPHRPRVIRRPARTCKRDGSRRNAVRKAVELEPQQTHPVLATHCHAAYRASPPRLMYPWRPWMQPRQEPPRVTPWPPAGQPSSAGSKTGLEVAIESVRLSDERGPEGTRIVPPIWKLRGFSGLAIRRAQMESLCAATLLDASVLGTGQGPGPVTWAGLAGRDDSVGLWWRWSRPPTGCVAVWPRLPDTTDPSCRFEP